MIKLIPSPCDDPTMELGDFKLWLLNRYTGILLLLVLMLFLHSGFIPIHPLIFIVWPLSLWFVAEIVARMKGTRLLAFTATFAAYLVVTQLLVVIRPEGIFFDLEPIYNLVNLSYVVLAEAILLFLYDAIANSLTSGDVAAYVGFASTIPWLSPAIVEAFIIMRWFFEGKLQEMTAGKGVGGAGFNDILFFYGGVNLAASSLVLTAGMLGLLGSKRLRRKMKQDRKRREKLKEDHLWMAKAWENPITLLSSQDREEFLDAHRHLDEGQRNELLRKEVLPSKGIVLIDPRDMR